MIAIQETNTTTTAWIDAGGTIFSGYRDGVLVPQKPNMQAKLSELLTDEVCRFETHHFGDDDSSDLEPFDYLRLAGLCYQLMQQPHIRALAIVMATDAAQYVLAYLSFAIQNPRIPILITGAMQPPCSVGYDGARNIRNAHQVACRLSRCHEVLLVFAGRIIRGVRVLKVTTEDSDAFRSVHDEDLGSVANGTVVIDQDRCLQWTGKTQFINTLGRVKLVTATLHNDPDELEMADKYDGLVLAGFGNGNLPRKFRKRAEHIARTHPVVITTNVPWGKQKRLYATAPCGLVEAADMVPHVAVVKLAWLLGHVHDLPTIRERFQHNYVGEFGPNGGN